MRLFLSFILLLAFTDADYTVHLQEKGLLRKYYKQFRKSVKDDPSGYKTLVKILDSPDMDEFKKQWEAFVLKLKF